MGKITTPQIKIMSIFAWKIPTVYFKNSVLRLWASTHFYRRKVKLRELSYWVNVYFASKSRGQDRNSCAYTTGLRWGSGGKLPPPKLYFSKLKLLACQAFFRSTLQRVLPRMFKEEVVQKDVLNTFIFGRVREGGLCVLCVLSNV